ncbi:hypothetical protein CALCODRAFT_509576 [Calocera cornea HHB12733]|uniref:Uncharacterized protein n=1 Tax=Calocera cornea HHB12733 TaxID=1353952 RepID=A0A165F6X2_9BASI|nr:hypothetical protein CALCODRAFT_509576 [Calocera cornea HHB12733]
MIIALFTTNQPQMDFTQFLEQQLPGAFLIPAAPDGGSNFAAHGVPSTPADFDLDPSFVDGSAFSLLDAHFLGDQTFTNPRTANPEDIFSPVPLYTPSSSSSPDFEEAFPTSPFNQRGLMNFGVGAPATTPSTPGSPINLALNGAFAPITVDPSLTVSSPEEREAVATHIDNTSDISDETHLSIPTSESPYAESFEEKIARLEEEVNRLQRTARQDTTSGTGRTPRQATTSSGSRNTRGKRITRSMSSSTSDPIGKGKRKRNEDEDEDEDEDEVVEETPARKSKRSKKDVQDGDSIRAWACPYPHHQGSSSHCNILVGSLHEIPRHLVTHLIEEEDRLRDDPTIDVSTLVFGGAPSNRHTCQYCHEEFSRWDAWVRHTNSSRKKKGNCSTPVGMHGQHPDLETFETNAAAEVLAKVKVSGEKKRITEIIEVYSTWSDRYRFKNARGGQERQPRWLLTTELPARNSVAAYSPHTAP